MISILLIILMQTKQAFNIRVKSQYNISNKFKNFRNPAKRLYPKGRQNLRVISEKTETRTAVNAKPPYIVIYRVIIMCAHRSSKWPIKII